MILSLSLLTNTGLCVTSRQTDRRTDGRTHDDSMYRISIASCGKKMGLCHSRVLLQVSGKVWSGPYSGIWTRTGPDQTSRPTCDRVCDKTADFVADPNLRPGSREKVRAVPCGSGRARVVEFSLFFSYCTCAVCCRPAADYANENYSRILFSVHFVLVVLKLTCFNLF